MTSKTSHKLLHGLFTIKLGQGCTPWE